MMTCRIQIGSGDILDSLDGWGFIFIDSDRRMAAPEKKRVKTSYEGEPGEHEDPYTVADAFDYWVKFAIDAPNSNLESANAKVAAFNTAFRKTTDEPGVVETIPVTVYNDYMRVKVVGTPEVVETPDELYRRQDGSRMDCAEITLNIRVTRPELCDFNLLSQEPDNDEPV